MSDNWPTKKQWKISTVFLVASPFIGFLIFFVWVLPWLEALRIGASQ